MRLCRQMAMAASTVVSEVDCDASSDPLVIMFDYTRRDVVLGGDFSQWR